MNLTLTNCYTLQKEEAEKKFFFSVRTTKRGEGVKAGPLRIFFKLEKKIQKKFYHCYKLEEGGGGVVRALVVGPLKTELCSGFDKHTLQRL